MNLDYPFHFDGRGRSAETTDDDHVRDMIEMVLFTAPGQRVNRPTFGSGLMELVFAPNGDAMAAATQLAVQAALHQWLGDVIQVEQVSAQANDGELLVSVTYVVRARQERQTVTFARRVG